MGRASNAKKARREGLGDPRRKRNPLNYVTGRRDGRTGKVAPLLPRWNGEACFARRVLVVAAPWTDDETGEVIPLAWTTILAGQTRAAVEVRYGHQPVFYLDDEPVNPADETPELRAFRMDRGLPFMRGSLGFGWEKLTLGMGLPDWGHRELAVERVLSCRDCGRDDGECECG